MGAQELNVERIDVGFWVLMYSLVCLLWPGVREMGVPKIGNPRIGPYK